MAISKDAETLAAANFLFESLVKLSSAAIVFSAIAYYFGEKVLDSLYSDLGAGWYVETLPWDRKVGQGLIVVVPFVVCSVLTVSFLAAGVWTTRSVRRGSMVLLVLALLFSQAGTIQGGTYSPLWFLGAAALYIFAAGVFFGEIVALVRDADRLAWSARTLYLILAGLYLALSMGAPVLGHGLSGLEMLDNFKSSPLVRLAVGPQESEWRLLSVNGQIALLARSQTNGPREFRLSKLDSTVQIFASGGSGISHEAKASSAALGSGKGKLVAPSGSATR